MEYPIKFTVFGVWGKGRPRFTKGGHAYTPETTRQRERIIAEAFRGKAHFGFEPYTGRVMLYIKVYHGIPKNTPKKNIDALLKSTPQKKPDIDNIIKIVADAIQGEAYNDDTQI